MFANRVSPVDLLGSVSYIRNIRTIKEGFEEVQITTLGIKNVDIVNDLKNIKFPIELFTAQNQWRPTSLEKFVEANIPILAQKIVVIVNRTMVRQSPYAQQRSIPLL